MLPYIDLGFIKIPSYTLMLVVGVIAYALYTYFTLKKEGKDIRVIEKAFIVSILAFAVMGITAFLFNSLFHSIEEGRLVLGGITWAGGVVGAFPAFVILTHFIIKEEKGSEIEFFSLVVPGIVLGHAFGRIGCFLAGCCYGNIAPDAFGVVFPAGSLAAHAHHGNLSTEPSWPVYPTQLYEAVFEFLLFAFMVVFKRKFKCSNAEIYLIAYGTFRFGLEFLRGDDRGSTGLLLSPSQILSVLLVVTGVLIILFKRKVIFKNLNDKLALWREQVATGYLYKVESQSTVYLNDLDKLFTLYKKGAITEEEYLAKKNDILTKL
ncbi:MAG: prolipoprotein diacylglyceryl transferase [Clostridia bacterium]|nr:prolipoprotein diacylglyceryl transferase [Clostridia bacterium]